MFCSHAYPHTSELANIRLPRALKDTGLVLYSVFKSLGIELDLVHILSRDDVYAKNRALGLKGKINGGNNGMWSFGYDCELHDIKRYLLHDEPLTFSNRDFQSADIACSDVGRRWKWFLMTRKVPSMEAAIDYVIKKIASTRRQPPWLVKV